MAQKKIIDFPLRTDFDQTVNLVGDDTIQTWRNTGQQVKDFCRRLTLQTKAANYQALINDGLIRVSGNSAITMPDATLCPEREYVVKKIDAVGTTATIDFLLGQSADGETSLSLTERYSFFRLVSNGVTFDITGAM